VPRMLSERLQLFRRRLLRFPQACTPY
jgi:hypothetical protein